MESQRSPAELSDAAAAATALAGIEEQHLFVDKQLGRYQWVHPSLGLLLAVATSSLVWRNMTWFTVVVGLYVVSLLPLMGTPVRIGIVPRDGDRRTRVLLTLACLLVLAVPYVAVLGPQWVSGASAVFVLIFVTAFGRWRSAILRAGLNGPVRHNTTQRLGLLTRIGTASIFPAAMAAGMGAAVSGLSVSHLAVRSAAILIYYAGAVLLLHVQLRIGDLPSHRSPSRIHVTVVCTVLAAIPVAMIALPHNLWWHAAAGCLLTTGIFGLVSRSQRRALQAADLMRPDATGSPR